MNRLKRKEADRPKAFWGALISAGLGIAGALLNSRDQEKQRRLQANLEDYNNSLKEAQGMTNALNAGQDYQQNYLQQFKQQARLGTTRRLGSRNIMITDGGNAKKIGNNIYLLRGGSHEDINETGQTGIGINVGGNEIEAEGGEVAQRKGNSLRIYSAQPILGGMSPAQAILRGYNKDFVFKQQQAFKKRNGLKDDGSKQYRPGGEVPYNHNDPTGLFGGNPHPLAKTVDISGVTSYGDVKKLIDKKRRGEIPTTQEYLGALSAIPAIGRIARVLNLIGNVADATTFMKDVKESEAKENAYQNEIVKYRDIHGKIKTGRRGSMPYTAHELRKRLGGLTSKDRGSSKHPYPSVASKDFAGGNRSYPIPTKADAIDALRLTGLHGRSDVRNKVYSKYPELRKKADFGTWVKSNRNNNVLANLLYESGIIDKNAWRNMLRDIHTFTGMGSDPYNDNQDEAVVTPGFGIPNQAQILRNVQQANKLMQAAKASQAAQRTAYAAKEAKDFYRDLGINIPVGRSQTYNPAFRSSLLAARIKDSNDALKLYLNNTHLPKGIKLTPTDQSIIDRTAAKIITPREAELVKQGINISQSARNMTSGANPFLYVERTPSQIRVGLNRAFGVTKQGFKSAGQKVKDFGNKVGSSSTYRTSISAERVRDANGRLIWKQNYKYKPWVKATAGATGTAGIIGLGVGLSNTKSEDKNIKAQLDAKGKPISPYIARPQELAKPQAKKSVPARKDTIATKHATRQVPDSIARKDTTRTDTTRTNTTRTDTTRQVNKVVKRQVRTTPQYKGNTTKGNYQLHDGETKIINGVKYTRRGNTIINHKTNVGYIYDKNGNYTGQADYSKVGNFNQAFDAARAAGRSQFIYRAGKYNNYSTVKETNAKKEALNRRIGARRIAKRMGCLTNPPVERFKCGGRIRPKAEDGMLAPIYSYGIDRRRFPSFAPIDITPRAIPNFKPVSVPINTKTPFDPNSVPYLGKQSSFKPTTQDYIGLGIDTLASLGIGLINSSAASKTYLPERTAIIQASKLPTYYNVAPQVEEVKRQRDILNEEIANNTSSSVAALNRISRIRGAATGEINKLYATKENEENKMLTQDALNQQQVAAENAKLQADYETNKANILNAASQAKANALSGTLSGISQAWNNFASSVENRYDTRQNEIAAISSANSPSVVKNAVSLGYNLSPEVLANLYKNSKNEELRNTILGRLSPDERKRYGIK